MKKRLAAFFLCIVLLGLIFSNVAFAADDVFVTGDLTATISYAYNIATGELVINGTGDIPGYAFRENELLDEFNYPIRKLVISEGIETINTSAFSSCRDLLSVSLPDSLKRIGEGVFSYCFSLQSVTLPDNIESVSSSSFDCVGNVEYNGDKPFIIYSCAYNGYVEGDFVYADETKTVLKWANHSLEEVTIPSTVEEIGVDAFRSNLNLKKVVLPDGLKIIRCASFYECYNLYDVTVPESIANVEWNSFNDVLNVNYIGPLSTDLWGARFYNLYIKDGIFYEDSSMKKVLGAFKYVEEANFPSSVEIIEENAFHFSKIKKVTFSEGLKTICFRAFDSCYGLTEINLPSTLETICDSAFSFCSNAIITIPDSVKSVSDGALRDVKHVIYHGDLDTSQWGYVFLNANFEGDFIFDDPQKTILSSVYHSNSLEGKVTLPEGIREISDEVFDCSARVEKYDLPSTLKYIGKRSFAANYSLKEILIPEGVTVIDNFAFHSCCDLNKISLPNSVTFIGEYAFELCGNITNASLPENLSSVSEGLFRSAVNLKSIYIPKTLLSIGSNAFKDCNSLTDIYYSGSPDDWKKIEIGPSNDKLNWGTVNIHYNHVHTFDVSEKKNIVQPTYTEEGSYDEVGVCNVCGANGINHIIIHKLECNHKGETFIIDEKSATCSESGYSGDVYCSVCNELISEGNIIDSLPHIKAEMNSSVTSPTYTEKGYTTYTCTKCGYSYIDDYTDMLTLAKPTVYLVNYAGGITVKWNKITGATGYRIYRRAGNVTAWTLAKTVTSAETISWNDTSKVAGTKYQYKIVATAGTNKSADSAVKTIYYVGRATITALIPTAKGYTVKWNKVSGATGYRIYRKAGSATSWSYVKGIASATAVSWTDATKHVNGAKYQYMIVAVKKASDGVTYTAAQSAVKRGYFLTRPTITSASNAAAGKINVKWNKNAKVTGYQVRYYFGSTASAVNVKGANSLEKTLTNLTKGNTYKVYVRSYITVGAVSYFSALSPYKSVKIAK